MPSSHRGKPPQESNFKNCLSSIPVPPKLLEGIAVIKVYTNGKSKGAYLTLSPDKFTIYVSAHKVRGNAKGSGHRGGGGGGGVLRPILKKVTSIGSNTDDDGINEKMIDVGSIDRIQRGQDTMGFEMARRRNGHHSISNGNISASQSISSLSTIHNLDPNRSFAIIFRGEHTLSLMMGEEDVDRDEVLDALERLLEAYVGAKKKDRSNTLNATKLGKVLDRINFHMRQSLSDEYEKFAKMIGLDRSHRRRGLTFEQTVTFLHKIKRDTWQVKPVVEIWNRLFGETMNNGKPRMRVSASTFLQRFLVNKQGTADATADGVRDLFRRLNGLEIANVASSAEVDELSAERYIDKDRFEAYLVSEENDAFDPKKQVFDPGTMDRPLSEYWISSSHNTYLTGDQLSSKSSTEMYVKALYRGCRCLELDCWDGDRDGDQVPIPIVYHGHTMTSKIQFRDIVKSIKVFLNFNPDSFPIILSLENHCSIPYQEVMARHLIDVLGDSLYVPTEQDMHGPLKSPNELKGKVLLKGRRITNNTPEAFEEDQHDNLSDTDSDDDSEVGGHEDDVNDDCQKLNSKAPPTSKQSTKVAEDLSRITLFHGTVLRNFAQSATNPTNHMHSLNESKVRKFCRQGHVRGNWIFYNRTHMSRTFPSGSRVDSSNYSPIPAWSAGCQMVALNFQTNDAAMRLNHGRFRVNGCCGYVPIPASLVDGESKPPPPSIFSVRVLSGSCLPKPRGRVRGECVNPCVRVSLYDISPLGGKEIVTHHTTKIVDGNGFFPIWNQEKFRFRAENPDVAVLVLAVWDKFVGKSDDFIASASVPIDCLREGYRSVKLFGGNGARNGAFECASLLIEVKKTAREIVPKW